ncbi:MAG: P1 family peptidase [Pseudomonadota bacterium]
MNGMLMQRKSKIVFFAFIAAAQVGFDAGAQDRPRARDLGIPFDGEPGANNAITDVTGVEVGYATLIEGDGALKIGEGPVRTGVTAIHPLGRSSTAGVFAARFTMNGDGEMTGSHWIDEFGTLFGPILLTNTVSVSDVHAAAVDWMRARDPDDMFHLPVVAETWDGDINDHYGRHIKKKHVYAALDSARSGKLQEGNVGGGTGMAAFGFKAGTGTASRIVGPYTVGVLVQANHGIPWGLTVAGVPVGRILNPDESNHFSEPVRKLAPSRNSITVIVATDAPLLPMQLERFAKRPAMGVARTGGVAERGSGEIFLAFSTSNELTYTDSEIVQYTALTDDARYTLDYLYEGVIQATEEAIINAMIAAETMVGVNGVRIESIDHETLQEIMQRYNRLRRK